MRKIFISLFFVLPLLLSAQIVRDLKKTIELKMPKTATDDNHGTRGAAVVWNPVNQKYYAAFAGNKLFPFAVFSSAGRRLSGENVTCLNDTRGMWYNPTTKELCGNGYSDIGWFRAKLDAKGFPGESEVYAMGLNQPDDNSIGVYNAGADKVYFLSGQLITVYDADAKEEVDSTIRLNPGISKKEDIDEYDDGLYLSEVYNSNVLIYTGINNAEFGLLNIGEKQVELYDRKTGLMTQKLKLPPEVNVYPAFNFSYANGIFWAFDQDTRTWVGYK